MENIKKLTLEQAKDIANKYFACTLRISSPHGCIEDCKGCPYDYGGTEIKEVMNFVLELKEQKNGDDKIM